MKKFLMSLAILGLAAGSLLALTQTGNLMVTVSTQEGQVLPGANVVVTSNVLMGQRTQLTSANGKATFRNLPPGTYTVTVTMDGFQTARQTDVAVRIQKTNKVTVALNLGEAREIITVVETKPLVDTSNNTVAVEFDFENYINHMPTGRHYNQLAGMAAGVQAQNNPSIFGSGSYDNLYLIDGVNSNDSRVQTWTGQVNMDAIQDVQLMAGGISAEYGQSTSVMNMVTKSGSNEFHGVGRLQMQRKEWNDTTLNDPNRDDDDTQRGRHSDQWDFSGGGPLYPDTIWWFASYTDMSSLGFGSRRLDVMDEGALTDYTRDYGGYFFSIKGTVQLGEDIKASVFYKEDPIDIINAGAWYYYGSRMLPSADFTQKQGGDAVIATASWVVSESAFVEGRWSQTRGLIDLAKQTFGDDYVLGTSYDDRTHFNSTDNWWWGAIPEKYESDRNADVYGGAINWLLTSENIGEHDIKVGVEYLDNWSVVIDQYYPGGEYIQTSDLAGVGFDNIRYVYRVTYENRLPQAEIHSKYWTVYIQDSAQISDALTVNLGLRSDTAGMDNNQEAEVFSSGIVDSIAPRVGFAYDLDGNSIHGSFGRYYDIVSQYFIDYFNVFPIPETGHAWEPTDGVDGRNGWTEVASWTNGLSNSPHTWGDTSLQYMDEVTAGADILLTESMAVGVTGIWRVYRDGMVLEDLDGNRAYTITTLETDDYGSKWKEYWGVTLDFRKRATDDNLFLAANLAWNNLEGISENNSRTMYLSVPYRNYDNMSDWWRDLGRSNLDAKIQATYFFPNNWYVGVSFAWTNGPAPTSYDRGSWPGYGLYTRFPNGGGDMDRLPFHNIDVQFGIEQDVEFPFDIPFTDNNIKVGIYANIFNITDNQSPTGVQTYLNSSKYGTATAWRNARNYQLGFRIEL